MLKPCTLELGGKSAAIILEDVDLAAAIPMMVFSGVMNAGQGCVNQTRILAPRSRYDEIVAAVTNFVTALPVGPPSDPAAQIGPLISEKQRTRVEGYIAKGIEEGARLVCGGGRPEGLDNGFFIQPTVFADVDNKMTIAQEEIFGPVLAIIPYDTEEDAIAIANDSVYGLAGSVWTTDVPKGIKISQQIRTGTYGINWYAFDPGSPFGGYKNSGIGRENGPEGVEHFTQQKSVLLPMATPSRSWARCPSNGAGASANAIAPSFASLEVNTGTRIFICSANIVSGLHPRDSVIIRLVATTASGPLAVIFSANAIAASRAVPGSAKTLTSPSSCARSAGRLSPVSANSMAIAYGMRSGNRSNPRRRQPDPA